MNAEALIGAVLGTCTLQKLIGQGGMGAVYLAQQSRPRRQVAVKVLLPMSPLSPHQLAAFLERFRRETDAAASLEHPNIVPVHEYGERDGLAYLVMPYISGGTLRDEMEREGPLPLEIVVNYLEQISAALDFAHERGVIHRDIKPANILLTVEGRLLLTDFGLVKIVAEGQTPQARLTGAGAPVGTPDYMAPEQVIGEGVDSRADLYSLGVLLFQMVTGVTPFQGETPMQIAAQHLQIPPPSPQMLRSDLPVVAERVMLRALAKRPADRYSTAQEMAHAFRMALVGISGITSTGAYTPFSLGLTGPQRVPAGTGAQRVPMNMNDTASQKLPAAQATNGRLFAPKAPFDPAARAGTGMLPSVKGNGLLGGMTGKMPAASNAGGGLLSRTGMFPAVSTGMMPAAQAEGMRPGGLLSRTGKFPQITTTATMAPAGSVQAARNTPTAILPSEIKQLSPAQQTTTGALGVQGQHSVKLTGPVKVVQVPVVGQPGRYVTGLLPSSAPLPGLGSIAPAAKKKSKRTVMIVATLLVVLLLVMGTGGAFLFLRSRQMPVGNHTTAPTKVVTNPGKPNLQATAAAQATATFQKNTLLFDPLNNNIHNWPTVPTNVYAFKDGAYHITDQGDNGRATVLQSQPFVGSMVYTLTAQEIVGDDGSANNSFGMIMRFNQQNKNNKTVTTFYSFEVVNTNGGEYQFWRYDDTQVTGQGQTPWKDLWHQTFGTEFHMGHGANAINTFKIGMNGDKFSITVNGKLVTNAIQDATLTSGTVGMIVNLNGTEIAFKNLLLTRG